MGIENKREERERERLLWSMIQLDNDIETNRETGDGKLEELSSNERRWAEVSSGEGRGWPHSEYGVGRV